MIYKISGACKSVIGNVRENNEDNYYFNFQTLKEDNTGSNKISTIEFENSDNVICAVFDGMGGESNGERASYLAAKSLSDYLNNNVSKDFSWIDYINNANNQICSEIHNNIRMGTTLAAVRFTTNFFDICNLGDSKIFGLKGKKIVQLSYDHTDKKLQEKLHVEGVKSYKLTQHLGIKENEMSLKPYIKDFEYGTFDKILICSDGLTDMVSTEKIKEILNLNIPSKNIISKLIDSALSNGGKDNITVIVLEIKAKKENKYKKFLFLLGIILIALLIFILKIHFSSFRIIKDGYSGGITVGDSYEFVYKGNYIVEINNENAVYEDNKIIAKNEGTCTIKIVNKKGEVLYNKTIKIFPK